MQKLLSLRENLTRTVYRHGFNTWKLSRAISLHIRSNYDAVKNNCKVKLPKGSGEYNYPEKHIFSKISGDYDQFGQVIFFGRNFIDGSYVREFMGIDGHQRARESIGFIQSSTQKFEDLFNRYVIWLYNNRITFKDSLSGQAPFIVKKYESGELPAEFLVIIDSICPFLKDNESIVYGSLLERIRKYSLLFVINRTQAISIVKSAVQK